MLSSSGIKGNTFGSLYFMTKKEKYDYIIPGRILNYCLNHCFTFLTIQIYSSINLTLYTANLADNKEQ